MTQLVKFMVIIFITHFTYAEGKKPMSFYNNPEELKLYLENEVNEVWKNWEVPQFQITIVSDNKILWSGAFNHPEFKDQPKDVRIPIASLTKSFDGALMAKLVDEKKISWTEKVSEWDPSFQLKDPWMTKEL